VLEPLFVFFFFNLGVVVCRRATTGLLLEEDVFFLSPWTFPLKVFADFVFDHYFGFTFFYLRRPFVKVVLYRECAFPRCFTHVFPPRNEAPLFPLWTYVLLGDWCPNWSALGSPMVRRVDLRQVPAPTPPVPEKEDSPLPLPSPLFPMSERCVCSMQDGISSLVKCFP